MATSHCNNPDKILEAAAAIHKAEALVITSGAGMGVDSGLPDFRGKEGFWKAYPPLKKLGISYAGMSNPEWFEKDPELAWGFFSHCYHLYNNTNPHEGFQILKRWGDNMKNGCFAYTSNVDGHFQKAGFSEDQVCECHGSIHYLQCIDPGTSTEIWPVPKESIKEVSAETLRMKAPFPIGPPGVDGSLARPNILMFDDLHHIDTRRKEQETRFTKFKELALGKGKPFVVVEIGAGRIVPTIRYTSGMLIK